MTTFSTTGLAATFNSDDSEIAELTTFEFSFVALDDVGYFVYDGDFGDVNIISDFNEINIDGNVISSAGSTVLFDTFITELTWTDNGETNTTYTLEFYDFVADESYLVTIAGDALPPFGTVDDFTAFVENQVVDADAPFSGSGFEPGDQIPIGVEGVLGFSVTENDTVNGTDFDDVYDLGIGTDVARGGLGDDAIYGGNGGDDLYGQQGSDVIEGGGGNDYLIGGGDNDMVFGGVGNDRINGGSGADEGYGDAGNDKVYGNGGQDDLYGGADDDLLVGGGGLDELFGGDGHDTLSGGRGRDVLTDGAGADTLTGGSDKDTFVFSEESGTGNVITDYQDGIDRIAFNGSSFGDVTISDVDGSTLLSTDDWDVTLTGIDFTLISESDFVQLA